MWNGGPCEKDIQKLRRVRMKKTSFDMDLSRYKNKKEIPLFQIYYRKLQKSKGIIRLLNSFLFRIFKNYNHIELSAATQIGEGLYFGHPYCITINPNVIIGKNCNIHKGVTIGQENRGERKGTPVIGNNVWIGINSTIVGNITVGNDVLIAPNAFVNKDIPNHSIVFGNPCIVKHKENATQGYINRTV